MNFLPRHDISMTTFAGRCALLGLVGRERFPPPARKAPRHEKQTFPARRARRGRDELLNEVWGVDYVGGPRTLDQHVLQIRRKLGPSADRIETVHRAGYRYRAGS
jgi:hypothetical protein